MTHQIHSRSALARPAAQPIALGKARKLTRASFVGGQAEMIGDRNYTLGG